VLEVLSLSVVPNISMKKKATRVVLSDFVSDELRQKHKIKEDEIRYYTAEEVAKHNKRDNLWLIVDEKVYDVTEYVEDHVGGDAILRNPGKDNTKGFHGIQHPDRAHATLPDYYIGKLKAS